MAIMNIGTDSSDNIAYVYSNKMLKAAPVHNFLYLPGSAATTGVVASGPCILHSVMFQDSATATTYLVLSNNSSSVGTVGDSASAVAQFGTITKNNFPFNVALSQGLTYRVTGSAIGPTVIVYSLAS